MARDVMTDGEIIKQFKFFYAINAENSARISKIIA